MRNGDIPLLRDVLVIPGMRVLVRVDFNVPIKDGEVKGGFRILRSLETINFLRERGAKLILISHTEPNDTLFPVSLFLDKKVSHTFAGNSDLNTSRLLVEKMKEGDVLLLENVRKNEGEVRNDPVFARALASLADLYVNDAFSVSHRKHASVVGVPLFLRGCAGFLFEEEIHELKNALNPRKPLVFILGGAKFETKLPLVRKFQNIADTIIIGGALANDIYKAKGLEVGSSFVSGDVDLSSVLCDKKVLVPSEVVVRRRGELFTLSVEDICSEDAIIDASPEWIRGLESVITKAGTILWNGPFGTYESGGKNGTIELARLIAGSGAHSIVGGGDTGALLAETNLEEKFSFISTGGGAMLDFLANSTLPGIEALRMT